MKKVLILFGGNSKEHNVSCNSVNFIIDNIDKDIFNYELVGIDFDNNWYIVNENHIDINWKNKNIKSIDNIIEYIKKFSVVFSIIHGTTSEDGKLQSFFELFNIKYVGSNSFSSIISYDKILTKLLLEKYDIPQIPYKIYNEYLDINKINYPVIIKPAKSGSSIGINIAYNKKELKKALKIAKKYDNNILIEKYIKNNKELECAIIFKNKKIICSNSGEILTNGKFYDYNSKYINKTNTCIANIDESLNTKIKELSKKIFNILGCKNLSRVDFLYDLDNSKLYFNEINTIPGMTEISMYPKLLNNIGINNKDIITSLLNI